MPEINAAASVGGTADFTHLSGSNGTKSLDKTDDKAVAKHKELLDNVSKEPESYKRNEPYRELIMNEK